METQTKKWFYLAQDAAERNFAKLFTDYQCNWQTITKDRVIEHFTCIPKDGSEAIHVIVTINKIGSKVAVTIAKLDIISAFHS